MKKKILKGFTLIELIIVLAIFSVIMLLALSYIDPVSQMMTNTSVRERTAAYVDNIGEYVDKSIRYSQFVRIYENSYPNGTDDAAEEDALVKFVDDFFDGAVKDDFSPVTGKVHVMKLVNKGDGVTYKDGRIYESVYSFTAGDSLPMEVTPAIDPITGDPIEGTNSKKFWSADEGTPISINVQPGDFIKSGYDAGYYASAASLVMLNFPHSKVSTTPADTDREVINKEHFQEYCYFYQLGLFDYVPVSSSEYNKYSIINGDKVMRTSSSVDYTGSGLDAYNVSENKDAKFFYSKLVQRTKNGVDPLSFKPSERSFSLNIVSYQIKDGMTNRMNTTYSSDAGDTGVSIFRSPSSVNTVSMTFQNVMQSKEMESDSKQARYYQVDQVLHKEALVPVDEGCGKGVVNDGIVVLSPITYSNNPFTYYPAPAGDDLEVTYIIYTLPDEVEDSIPVVEETTSGGGPGPVI